MGGASAAGKGRRGSEGARTVRTWLRMAAAKPATMPLPRLMVYFAGRLRERLVSSDMLRNTSSWQNSFTVNCPIAYGICLDGAIVPALDEEHRLRRGARDVLAKDGQEACIEPRYTLFSRHTSEACHESTSVAPLRDEPYPRRLERSEKDVGEEPAYDKWTFPRSESLLPLTLQRSTPRDISQYGTSPQSPGLLPVTQTASSRTHTQRTSHHLGRSNRPR